MVNFEDGRDFVRLCELLHNQGFEQGVYWATECALYQKLNTEQSSRKDEN